MSSSFDCPRRRPQTSILKPINQWRKYKFDRKTRLVNQLDSWGRQIATKSWQFRYESYEEPKLRLLRERYKLDEVIARAENEFEEFIHLADWIYGVRVRTAGNPGTAPITDNFNALLFLEWAQGSYQWHCSHCSITFIQSCLSLGHQARFVHINHDTAEFWSNQYRKWIWIDPLGLVFGNEIEAGGAIYFRREGVPLSALEIHRTHLANEWDKLEVRPAELELSDSYKQLFSSIRVFLRNNWFSEPYHPPDIDPESPDTPYREGLNWVDEATPPRIGFHNTDREEIFNWSLNFTTIWLAYTRDWDVLAVTLETVTPNFSEFLVRIDGGEWEPRPAQFNWRLHLGLNRLEAKSRNRFGREGLVSAVEVDHAPEEESNG